MSAVSAPAAASTVQIPRLRIKAGGVALPRPIEAMVDLTNTWTASKWSAAIALNDADQMNAAWWASQANVRIEIDYALDGQTFVQQMIGNTDDIALNWEHNQLTLTGRDLTALLIDVKTAETYQNQTSSEIATLLAKNVGLGTSHIVATTTPIGEYYAGDAVRLSSGDLAHSITYWDLLVYLAQHENFDLFVKGTDLYFQPLASVSTVTFQVTVSRNSGIATANVSDLQLHRSLTLAKDITVTVKSYNSAMGKAVTGIAKRAAKGKATGPEQSYVFYKPNLTPAQAQDLANQRLSQITRHEKLITFDCPPELVLTPQGMIRLTGTGTEFDQTYYPDGITRTMSQQYATQSVVARNQSPSEQVALASGSQASSVGGAPA